MLLRKNFLVIAKEIVSSLIAMHEKNILHLNFNCNHILYKESAPGEPCIKIIGCRLSSSNENKANRDLIKHDLHCISPEQTRRFNRKVDFRSDFYSLSIIFYKLLTKIYPFESNTPLKLINFHIAQDTPLAVSVNPEISISIGNMVSKLLNKSLDERY